jgi:hypothetical protein
LAFSLVQANHDVFNTGFDFSVVTHLTSPFD